MVSRMRAVPSDEQSSTTTISLSIGTASTRRRIVSRPASSLYTGISTDSFMAPLAPQGVQPIIAGQYTPRECALPIHRQASFAQVSL